MTSSNIIIDDDDVTFDDVEHTSEQLIEARKLYVKKQKFLEEQEVTVGKLYYQDQHLFLQVGM